MSKAYTCDRCKQYFTDYGKEHDFDIAKVTRSNSGYIIEAEHLDLCDGCYAKLEMFMSGEVFYPEEKPQNISVELYESIKEEQIKNDMMRQLATERNHL
jgi:hypothetical protein